MNEDSVQAVRESYDRIADEYARRIFNELEQKPFDREQLDQFAAQLGGQGSICDMGCGPGHVARYLRGAGATVFGLDLSSRMVELARELNPEIPFREGNMLALELPDDSLAGITAFYAIVNIRRESLPLVFEEMERVLQPGGLLLIAFHVGDEAVSEVVLWGHAISMDFFLLQPEMIRELLETAGFSIEHAIEREPYAPEVEYQSRRAYILARKPGTSLAHRAHPSG